jgi:polyhydroxyalkanoate synthesis repressor PhaR
MSSEPPTPEKPIEIRKYPNRRYYETGRSRHLTVEEIRSLIREGHDVRITDSSSGADITGRILTQIILELDSPKLELFPVPLLTQMIRVNDQLVKGFFEKFFNQALTSFLEYQRHVEAQLREGRVLPSLFPSMMPWSSGLFHFGVPPVAPGANHHQTAEPKSGNGDLAGRLQALQEQIAALERRVSRPRQRKKKAPKRS